ncbi:glutathione S-transferase [Neptunomonas antarctica]|uniref:glutathione S-transferase n=1 Tax=Neptunomonas antarctica TaxID=619304 RepID=UPI001EE41490|nr:glutathione S-transferase [Neptunomonas antarctica]
MPILYSLQNCPYAMRARLVILLAQQPVLLRPITMKNKPAEMLAVSPKGTVPVLILRLPADIDNKIKEKQQVIDESLDIMLWALQRNDPENLLYSERADALPEMLKIIEENDKQFKPSLEKYKHAKRFHEKTEESFRLACEPFIQRLEQRLTQHEFLMGAAPSLLDYALLPFVRQFSKANRHLFLQGPYSHLQHWLNHHVQSHLYARAMFKYPLWLDSHEEFVFGE